MNLVQTMVENKISPSDVSKIEIYEKFKKLTAMRQKVTYVVSCLADEYGLKERAIYTIIKRFDAQLVM